MCNGRLFKFLLDIKQFTILVLFFLSRLEVKPPYIFRSSSSKSLEFNWENVWNIFNSNCLSVTLSTVSEIKLGNVLTNILFIVYYFFYLYFYISSYLVSKQIIKFHHFNFALFNTFTYDVLNGGTQHHAFFLANSYKLVSNNQLIYKYILPSYVAWYQFLLTIFFSLMMSPLRSMQRELPGIPLSLRSQSTTSSSMPSEGTSCVISDPPPVSSTLSIQRSTEVSCLSYHLILLYK